MSVTVKMERASQVRMDKAMRSILTHLGKDAAKVLKGHIRNLALDFAVGTKPQGKGNRSKKKGEEHIDNKINAVYWPWKKAVKLLDAYYGAGLKSAFVKLVKEGRLAEATSLLEKIGMGRVRQRSFKVGMFDGGRLHRKQTTGKVREVLIVTDSQSVAAYLRKVKTRVGRAKGGFAQAAMGLGGTRGFPKWMTRHRGKLGKGSSEIRKDRVKITIRNFVPYIKDALLKVDEIAAIRERGKRVETDLKRIQKGGKYRRAVKT